MRETLVERAQLRDRQTGGARPERLDQVESRGPAQRGAEHAAHFEQPGRLSAVLHELPDATEGRADERADAQDREPDLDLVKPGGVGWRVVQMDVLVAGEPEVAARLVGREIIEDHMDLAFRIGGHDLVHEVEELDAPASFVVTAHDRPVAASRAANSVVVPCRVRSVPNLWTSGNRGFRLIFR